MKNLASQLQIYRRRMKVCWGDGWIWMLFRVSLEVEEEERWLLQVYSGHLRFRLKSFGGGGKQVSGYLDFV
ncbi:hypothetical protein HanXRQr2_Chr12g0535421 [Helianthus annuus]|uniref:Uncharacterized protein n=1 Tax=Helianthus annuus TaxID=4232 RepID=A0A9K3HFL2_HELAN|nr:hypothetical protein HanXRQr2_Chr12g0535421 [Helianthus annuus]